MSGGDKAGVGVILMFIVCLIVACFFGLISAVIEHPWLLLCIAGAAFCFVQIRRGKRKARLAQQQQQANAQRILEEHRRNRK